MNNNYTNLKSRSGHEVALGHKSRVFKMIMLERYNQFFTFDLSNFIHYGSMNIQQFIHAHAGLPKHQIGQVLQLLQEGCTIPFMARYRKERTGNLDETQIERIQELNNKFFDLIQRKEYILKTIQEQEKLTAGLQQQIEGCFDLATLEDIYLPYKQKRQTKASQARKLGLEPLARKILQQSNGSLQELVKPFINNNVPNLEAALEGARHIIAERIAEDPSVRNYLRSIYQKHALIQANLIVKKKAEAQKYRDYFKVQEKISSMPAHRLLAILRGEQAGFLKVKVSPDNDRSIHSIERSFISNQSPSAQQIKLAIADAFKRLIHPSLEKETRNHYKEKADILAIELFAKNLSRLLLAPPLGPKIIMAIDPGFRSGCKVVVLDETGSLTTTTVIYPHPPQTQQEEARKTIDHLMNQYQIGALAIGNGTAGRETMDWLKKTFPNYTKKMYLVSEQGASIYSASEKAREEFPTLDLTVRGAISIGRRLADPLAELIKIDPKSIGVGQYQHDVDQKRLREKLDRVVERCVNLVGVELNTASKYLLMYVSGLGKGLAENIVQYRSEKGAFKTITDLHKVPRLGQKAFEQSAGFLRIRNSPNILDQTGIHPERYLFVQQMLKKEHIKLENLHEQASLLEKIPLHEYTTTEVGLPTLQDVIMELKKPGLDPRGEAITPTFEDNIRSIEDLKVGLILSGTVTNITQFGAFVDIGIKETGLVHLSQLTDRYIKSPYEVVQLNDQVKVKVTAIDLDRKRVQLSMKDVH